MFARISAKVLILVAASALVFFGIGLLGLALAATLTAMLGTAGAYALAGAVLVVPVALWAIIMNATKAKKPEPLPPSGIVTALLSAVARETPWIAVVGAGVASAAEMFLNRNRPKPKK